MKEVKINDFDWDGFKRREFRIVSASSQNLMLTLQALSEKGYVWGMTGSSLTEDEDMKNMLLRDVKRVPIYIYAGGAKKNGVVRDLLLSSVCFPPDHWNACENPCDYEHLNAIEALNVVMIDFEEEKNMITFEKVNAKDFDWKLFNDDQVVIAVDNQDMNNLHKVMELLDNMGYCWGRTKQSLNDKDTQGYKAIANGLYDHIYLSTIKGEIGPYVYWATELTHLEHPVKIVFDERTDNDKILITNDGKTTTATLYSNGKKAGVGTAICHDNDKFDIYTGATRALLRLEKNKKKKEMTDWERFVKGAVNMRVPKKYIQNFLNRAVEDSLTFKGTMSDWYLRWLTQDGDSIVVAVIGKYAGSMFMTEVLRDDSGTTVDYIPGMK